MDGKDECVSLPGFNHHLCMAWRQDNAGPHSVEEVRLLSMIAARVAESHRAVVIEQRLQHVQDTQACLVHRFLSVFV